MTLTQISSRGVEDTLRWSLGASGIDHYTFTGPGLTGTVNDPTIYLSRGQTYVFENNSGGHPFQIQSVAGSGGSAYNTGVTNNGGGNGTEIKITVPHDAPDILYYQCTSHANMGGTIFITGAVAAGSITTAKLAADAVDGTKLADNAVATEHIADTSVTLAKLEHGTGSNDGKFLRANNGADPTFEVVNTDLVADSSPQLGGLLDGNGNTANFTGNTLALGLPRGTTAQEPSASGYEGFIRYNNDDNVVYYSNGTDWLKINAKAAILTSVTGRISTNEASTLTLAGSGFMTANLVVNFSQSSDSIDTNVTVTPTSDTAATVAVPAAVYNNVTAGNAVSIKVTNADSITSGVINKTAVALPTGGTVTTSGSYRIHTFNSSGTFANTLSSNLTVDFLVIAGGAGAAASFGGGGGAGGYRTSVGTSGGSSSSESAITINNNSSTTITVGAGGAGGPGSTSSNPRGGAGSTSSIGSTITTVGGGTGGSYRSYTNYSVGLSGGSGGGGGSSEVMTSHSGGSGTSGQGTAGGYGYGRHGYLAGGGGGAGTAGGGAVANSRAGHGGNGLANTITGTSVTRAGGGGGAAYGYSNGTADGNAGSGGGGVANTQSSSSQAGSAGAVNTGSGGGGGSYDAGAGGAGGSGVVILRYTLP